MHALSDHLGSTGQRYPLGQNHELVPPETPDRVTRPQDATQPTGHHLQQLITGPVTERVVRVLEVVQIDEEDGQRLAGPARPLQHLLGAVQNQLPVRQPRERVVERAVGEKGFELLAFSGVADVHHIAGNRGAIRLVGDDRFDVADRPVPAQHAELERRRHGRRLELAPEQPSDELEVFGVHEVQGAPPDEVRRLVLQQILESRRHVTEITCFAEDHRDVGGVLNQ